MKLLVVLSEAKDLMVACDRHGILRCAQDDGKDGLEGSSLSLGMTFRPEGSLKFATLLAPVVADRCR